MLAPGTTIGNYVVDSEIGGGGMARLYCVRHMVMKTKHALKVLDPAHRDNPEVRRRFLDEALIMFHLNNPHIVRVTDSVATPEVAGIIMELVDGPNLEEHIQGLKERPSGDEIRAIFLPVLAAVGEVHRQGIVHRDLKPANILLEYRGGRIWPKVIDFGIARVTEAAELVRKKGSTHVDARMGTVSYMSPEQVRRAREVTFRSDIFSLGATLYELATLHVAFDGESDYDVMHQIVHGQITRPEELIGVDLAIAAAIRTALQPDPERRFPSCEAFAAALVKREPTADIPREPACPRAGTVAKGARPRSPMPLIAGVGGVAGGAGLLWIAFSVQTPPAGRLETGYARGEHQEPGQASEARIPTPPTPTPLPPPKLDHKPFNGCYVQSGPPTRAAITCLKAGRPATAEEIRGWFKGIAGSMVDVIKLQRASGERLICFEVPRDRWPVWDKAVGDATGEEACYRVGWALLDAKIGRPGDDQLSKKGTYEYEIYDRFGVAYSKKNYPVQALLGDLDKLFSSSEFDNALSWLSAQDYAADK